MASLSDQIDRLSRNTRSIKATAELIARGHDRKAGAGPYTRAVLSTDLGDLIRDIDPSELALFTIQRPALDERAAPAPELARAAFTGATPLRRPAPKRDDALKPRGVEPEVYAQAALKCIDRYQSIRPMSRARSRVLDIIARLKVAREEITGLSTTLEDAPAPDASLQTLVQKEEKRIHDLQAKMIELQQRKQQAIKDKEVEARAATKKKIEPKSRAPPPQSPQDQFWNTPMASAKTLRFTENLMNERVDLGDVSVTSFMEASPLAGKAGTSTFADQPSLSTPIAKPGFNSGPSSALVERSREETEPVVTVQHEPSPKAKSPPSRPLPQSRSEPKAREPRDRAAAASDPQLERYAEKFWTTMGDQILPGEKKSRAKDTISQLRAVSSLTPSPSSPSPSTISAASSANAVPTAQQILTAYLLLTLLTSLPDYAIPMNKAKDLLSAKGNHWGSTVVAGQGTSRIIYGCVAKRLLKIDRGGGEQIVRFDV